MTDLPLLHISGVTRNFGGVGALQGVELSVHRGEILGLIGPNGAGKTTLVNCVTGLLRPGSGAITFKGTETTRLPDFQIARMGMARTFQVVKPFKQLTVRDNVAVGAMFGAAGQRRSARQAQQYAETVIERVKLQECLSRPASELTIPQLKRLELAKALAMDPELLFLDEVMAGLNLSEIDQVMELIHDVRRSGVTFVVIEHVMKAILGLSDRVAVLHFGRKIAEGAPTEIMRDPAVVEAYLGERFARRAQAGGSGALSGAAAETLDRPSGPGVPSKESPARQSEAILSVENLVSGYGEVQVLREISLEVRPGEIVSLIGSNGAGKTTLLRTLSQLIAPRSGRIRIHGKDMTVATPPDMVLQGMVHVPQGRSLFAGLTVKENLLQGAYLRKERGQVAEDLHWFLESMPNLRARLDQHAGRLSGGEQQMCAIGRGFMGRPRLLMIDELSLGLAPKIVDTLLELIRRINRQGTAILLVEQDVQVALEHASRGYVMENGRIVMEGPSSDLLMDPKVKRAYLGV